MLIVKIYLRLSLELLQTVWGVHFQIVPWSSLKFLRSIAPFLSSWC